MKEEFLPLVRVENVRVVRVRVEQQLPQPVRHRHPFKSVVVAPADVAGFTNNPCRIWEITTVRWVLITGTVYSSTGHL